MRALWWGGRRLLAFLIDALLLAVALAIPQWLLHTLTGFPRWPDQAAQPLLIHLWTLVSVSLPVWGYFIWMDRSGQGATLGKRAFSLRTITPDGRRISTRQAVIRTTVKLIPCELLRTAVLLASGALLARDLPAAPRTLLMVVNAFSLTSFGVLLITYGDQALHDMFAGTLVRRWPPPEDLF